MQLEPKNLNIPLARKSYFWLWAVAIVAVTGLAFRTYVPEFGRVFIASAILLLPVLLLLIAVRSRSSASGPGIVPNIASLAIVLIYMSFAKTYLVKWLAERIP